MNMKTRQRLESEPTAPAPTQPVDKLRLSEAAASPRGGLGASRHCPGGCLGGESCYGPNGGCCFADDE